MSEDARFDVLEEAAYDRIFNHLDSKEGAKTSLLKLDDNETLVEMAIEAAYVRRHEEAVAGKLDYVEWMGAIARDMSNSGPLVLALGIVSALVAGLALYAMSKGVPVGERLKTFYYVVSLGVGLTTFLIGSGPVYNYLHRKAKDPSEPQ